MNKIINLLYYKKLFLQNIQYSKKKMNLSQIIFRKKENFLQKNNLIYLLKRNFLFKRNYCHFSSQNIRNIAIIAHVDHGKTTLVDKLLNYSGTVKNLTQERLMDSNALEQERGITIFAKYTSIQWNNIKINILDTPGHGDFGGEVERILSMVDGVVLLVDVNEGAMSQTKYVLSKALKSNLKSIVVLNKMDRLKQLKDVDNIESEIFELFLALGANEEQMSYPTLYASARSGWVIKNKNDKPKDMNPLFEAILEYIPPPTIDPIPKFSMLVTTLESDNFFGRIITGKIKSGSIKINDTLHSLDRDGNVTEIARVVKLFARHGLERIPLSEAFAGDIVGVAGFNNSNVLTTLCDTSITKPIPSNPLDPPVLSMNFSPNSSPLAGKEGKLSTFPAIKQRLFKEIETNVSIQINQNPDKESIKVSGRGELQLGILIENMRREGYEFSVSRPEVVYKYENNVKLEPIEEVIIDVDDQYSGLIIEKFTAKKGEIQEMKQISGKTRLIFLCPSRTLVGLRTELLTETSGSAVINHIFHSYQPYKGKIETHNKGALISTADGECTTYALNLLEPRGILFVSPGTHVYEGMVIGEHSRENDLDVNPVRTKHLSNVRSVQKEDNIKLIPPKKMSLEEYLSYIRRDELLEITPKSIRLRKIQLKAVGGKRKIKDD